MRCYVLLCAWQGNLKGIVPVIESGKETRNNVQCYRYKTSSYNTSIRPVHYCPLRLCGYCFMVALMRLVIVQAIYKTAKLRRTMEESEKRKLKNRVAHSAPGSVKVGQRVCASHLKTVPALRLGFRGSWIFLHKVQRDDLSTSWFLLKMSVLSLRWPTAALWCTFIALFSLHALLAHLHAVSTCCCCADQAHAQEEACCRSGVIPCVKFLLLLDS